VSTNIRIKQRAFEINQTLTMAVIGCLALCLVLPSVVVAACVDTPPFDDDWGWNEQTRQSCQLSTASQFSESSVSASTSGACVDTPPFNDDWGWNASLESSCRLSDSNTGGETTVSSDCIDTPPFDDNWGWDPERSASCQLSLAADTSSPPTDTNGGTDCVDTPPYNDDWGWNDSLSQSCRLSADSSAAENDVPSAASTVDSTAGSTTSSTTSNQCIDTPPYNDDWGWNNATSQSCRLGAATDSNNTGSTYQPYAFATQTGSARVSYDWTPALRQTWQGIKRRSVDAYPVALVNRPRSEMPGDAVSEGVGYGMIVALFSNDQRYFNRIWDAGERYLWNGQYYDWRADQNGTTIGFGAATDAEQDIAMMLIFADDLVQRGIWQGNHRSPQGVTYSERAQVLLNLIWDDMVDGGRYLRPGTNWGGRDLLNPGYFAPAWYRLYAQFDAEPSHNWFALIDQSYQAIAASPGYSRGLVPDWSNAWGNLLADGPGYNAYDNGHSMFKDGIRTLWRVAADALWFNDQRAITYLQNALRFLRQRASQSGTAGNANSPAHLANFYQMNGVEVPRSDIWTELNGGITQRSRNEHSHLTIAMWATAAVGVGDTAAAEAFSRELQTFYEGGDYFGLSTDPSGNNEDIARNELYFDQFLAWFGAAMLNGNFCNPMQCIR